jgi:hypothetical protein
MKVSKPPIANPSSSTTPTVKRRSHCRIYSDLPAPPRGSGT